MCFTRADTLWEDRDLRKESDAQAASGWQLGGGGVAIVESDGIRTASRANAP